MKWAWGWEVAAGRLSRSTQWTSCCASSSASVLPTGPACGASERGAGAHPRARQRCELRRTRYLLRVQTQNDTGRWLWTHGARWEGGRAPTTTTGACPLPAAAAAACTWRPNMLACRARARRHGARGRQARRQRRMLQRLRNRKTSYCSRVVLLPAGTHDGLPPTLAVCRHRRSRRRRSRARAPPRAASSAANSSGS